MDGSKPFFCHDLGPCIALYKGGACKLDPESGQDFDPIVHFSRWFCYFFSGVVENGEFRASFCDTKETTFNVTMSHRASNATWASQQPWLWNVGALHLFCFLKTA